MTARIAVLRLVCSLYLGQTGPVRCPCAEKPATERSARCTKEEQMPVSQTAEDAGFGATNCILKHVTEPAMLIQQPLRLRVGKGRLDAGGDDVAVCHRDHVRKASSHTLHPESSSEYLLQVVLGARPSPESTTKPVRFGLLPSYCSSVTWASLFTACLESSSKKLRPHPLERTRPERPARRCRDH